MGVKIGSEIQLLKMFYSELEDREVLLKVNTTTLDSAKDVLTQYLRMSVLAGGCTRRFGSFR